MRYVIDRFEGGYAVCEAENKEMINIDRKDIPSEAKEGDVLVQQGNEICLDADESKRRKENIQRLMDDLWI